MNGMIMLEAVCIIDLVVILSAFLPRIAPDLALHWLDAQAKNAKVTLAESNQPLWWLAHVIAQNNIEGWFVQQCNLFEVGHT